MSQDAPTPDTFAAIAEQHVQHRGESLTIPAEPVVREFALRQLGVLE
jgi:hypothetical protein